MITEREDREEGREGERAGPSAMPPEVMALALQRESRATAGKRMRALMEEEAEEDEAFWGQDFFKDEEAGDEEYETESNVSEDRVDSDFDDDVSSGDDSGDEGERDKRLAREERGKKKVLRAPGWKAEQQKKRAAAAAARKKTREEEGGIGAGPVVGGRGGAAAPGRAQRRRPPVTEGGGIRQSSRAVVLERRAAAQIEADEREKRRKQHRPKSSSAGAAQEPRLTQEQLLAEAAQTEIVNLRSLEELQKIEEAVKQKAKNEGLKQQYTGTVIRYLSTTRRSGMPARGPAGPGVSPSPSPSQRPLREYTVVAVARRDASGALERRAAHTMCADGQIRPVARDGNDERSVASALGLPGKRGRPTPVKRQVCCITGLPAKYLDPVTRQPFANAEAFKELRRRTAASR